MKTPTIEIQKTQASRQSKKKTHFEKERDLESIRSGLSDASFAYGRRNDIMTIMQRRCAGECLSDDAELIADLVVPFIVEAAILHRGHEPHSAAQKWFIREMPTLLATKGAEYVHQLVDDAIRCRAMAEDQQRGSRRYVDWLPKMPDLVAALRPTREEIIGLRGWACIDPPNPEQKCEAERLRKKAERAAKGATPREQSLSALKPWEAAGMSRAKWYRNRPTNAADSETETSAPYSATHGTDEPVSRIETGASVAGLPSAVTTITSPSLMLAETGYQGCNLTLSPIEIEHILSAHPVLNDNLKSHLDVIDGKMSKTPDRNKRAVRRRLVKDEARVAQRTRRLAA